MGSKKQILGEAQKKFKEARDEWAAKVCVWYVYIWFKKNVRVKLPRYEQSNWSYCLLFLLCVYSLFNSLSSIMLIWAAGARFKWSAHLHNRMPWLRLEPQTCKIKFCAKPSDFTLSIHAFYDWWNNSLTVYNKNKKLYLGYTKQYYLTIKSAINNLREYHFIYM